MIRKKLASLREDPVRGKEIFRIETLSDAVFAISVSLLIMSLEVPKTFSELRLIIRQFPPFLATVSMVFLIWWLQNNYFRKYGLNDTKIRWLNLALMVAVLFYVFPLKFLFSLVFTSIFRINYFEIVGREPLVVITENDLPELVLFFSIGYSLVWIIFFLLYQHAWHRKKLLKLTHVETVVLHADKRDALVQLSIGILGAFFALFKLIVWSQLTFLLIPVWLLINARLVRYEKKKLG